VPSPWPGSSRSTPSNASDKGQVGPLHLSVPRRWPSLAKRQRQWSGTARHRGWRSCADAARSSNPLGEVSATLSFHRHFACGMNQACTVLYLAANQAPALPSPLFVNPSSPLAVAIFAPSTVRSIRWHSRDRGNLRPERQPHWGKCFGQFGFCRTPT